MPPKDRSQFKFRNKENETLIKNPGDLNGGAFAIAGCNNCDIFLCDYFEQVFVDRCKNCRVHIGPTRGSIFIRNCSDIEVSVAAQQIRISDTKNITANLFSASDPALENVSNLKIGPYNFVYPGVSEFFQKANLNPLDNFWSQIFDFTPTEGQSNWEFIKPEENKQEIRKELEGFEGDYTNPIQIPTAYGGSDETVIKIGSANSANQMHADMSNLAQHVKQSNQTEQQQQNVEEEQPITIQPEQEAFEQPQQQSQDPFDQQPQQQSQDPFDQQPQQYNQDYQQPQESNQDHFEQSQQNYNQDAYQQPQQTQEDPFEQDQQNQYQPDSYQNSYQQQPEQQNDIFGHQPSQNQEFGETEQLTEQQQRQQTLRQKEQEIIAKIRQQQDQERDQKVQRQQEAQQWLQNWQKERQEKIMTSKRLAQQDEQNQIEVRDQQRQQSQSWTKVVDNIPKQVSAGNKDIDAMKTALLNKRKDQNK